MCEMKSSKSADSIGQTNLPQVSGNSSTRAKQGIVPSRSSRTPSSPLSYVHSLPVKTNLPENKTKLAKRYSGSSKRNKVNIDHLLDFQSYRDLPEYIESHSKARVNRHKDLDRSRKPLPNRIVLRGMEYINVHYKFVVDHRYLYKVQALDPNIPVPLENIVAVIAPVGNACPICLLETPVAPRMMTACGHIICLKCVLSLMATELPKAQKRQAESVIERYRECPLCQKIIRPAELKPVVFNSVDERFDTPRPQCDTILTLMLRPHGSNLALPRSIDEQYPSIDNFPSIQQSSDLIPYLRILKGDAEYVLQLYSAEKQQINDLYDQERELYNEPRRLRDQALSHIDDEIASWTVQLNTPLATKPEAGPHTMRLDSSNYFYYQTGFNSNAVYVLSPLDMKVLRATHANEYHMLPSLVVARVENIRFEDLTTEAATSKYKFLSHLPVGTSIGFMECDWRDNEFVNQETWNTFRHDLVQRSKNLQKKFAREEKARIRALEEEETRTRNFFAKENGNAPDLEYESFLDPATFNNLVISDHHDLPSLPNATRSSTRNTDVNKPAQQTTVWGTQIPKADDPVSDDEYAWDAEETIRKAKEQLQLDAANGKRKKKRVVLLSSF